MLKLEVGKKYIDGEAKVVHIVKKRANYRGSYPFEAEDGHCYTEEGLFTTDGGSEYDLVKEHKEPVSTKEWLKNNPWKIMINNEHEFNSVVKWLNESNFSFNHKYSDQMKALTNCVDESLRPSGFRVMYVSEDSLPNHIAPVITMTFETSIKDFVLPEIVSEKDKEIQSVREEMEALAQRLKDLEGK